MEAHQTSCVYTPADLETPFKLPAAPASQRRKGPKLGTFQTSPSRSYALVNKTGNELLIHHATCPSPSSTPRQSRVGSVTPTSTPQTPAPSHATLAMLPDLSETEFSDAAASQRSVDPILSAGPDFIASAGFSRNTSRASQTAVSPSQQSSLWLPPIPSFEGLSGDIHVQRDDPVPQEIDDSAFEDLLNFPADETTTSEEVSTGLPSSPIGGVFAIASDTTAAQAAPKTSPSSVSSAADFGLFNGASVTAWRNSANSRTQPRQPSNHLNHGLSLSGSVFRSSRPISQPPTPGKKRKLGSLSGRQPSQMLTSKRRLTTSHR